MGHGKTKSMKKGIAAGGLLHADTVTFDLRLALGDCNDCWHEQHDLAAKFL